MYVGVTESSSHVGARCQTSPLLSALPDDLVTGGHLSKTYPMTGVVIDLCPAMAGGGLDPQVERRIQRNYA